MSTVQARTLVIDGIAVHVEGPRDAPVVLMVHGWPDTWCLWDSTVAALSDRYRCVRFTLPGFDVTLPLRATSVARMIEFFDAVLDAVRPATAVTLLLHDWGCVFGYEYAARRPARVARIVGIDVGDHGSAALSRAIGRRGRRMVFGYQIWLALAWKIGGRVGDRMARWMAPRLRCPVPVEHIHAAMGYPYAMRWFGSVGGMRMLAPVADLRCPIFFVYGTRKYFMFHSPEWEHQLSSGAGSAVLALSAGHWVMLNKPAEFVAGVRRWLDESIGVRASP